MPHEPMVALPLSVVKDAGACVVTIAALFKPYTSEPVELNKLAAKITAAIEKATDPAATDDPIEFDVPIPFSVLAHTISHLKDHRPLLESQCRTGELSVLDENIDQLEQLFLRAVHGGKNEPTKKS